MIVRTRISEDNDSERQSDPEFSKSMKSHYKNTKKIYTAEESSSIPENSLFIEEKKDSKIVEKSPKERFARYDISIGNGSFKRVYKGYDFDKGKEVAWNVINVDNLSEIQITNIIEEVNIIKKLNHENIINYISGWFNEEKKEVVFISDLFSGGSLKKYLNRIKYPRLKVIKGWCKDILRGLNYLHEQETPIIHRDIKCDNVFVDKNDGKITIGDFGYSCELKNEFAKSFSGTPEFMAPEVFDMKYGTGADIYSFGMSVLEMVTLETPYKECESLIKIYDHVKGGILPKSLSRVKNEKVMIFIKNCLKKESERPTASQLLNSELLNDMESEDNNIPVPILNDSLTEIVNQDFENELTQKESNFDISRLDSLNKMKGGSNNKVNTSTNFESSLKSKFGNKRFSIKSTNQIINYEYPNNSKKHETFDNVSSESDKDKSKKKMSQSIKHNNDKDLKAPLKDEKIKISINWENKDSKEGKRIQLKIIKTNYKKNIKFNYNLHSDSVKKVIEEMKSQMSELSLAEFDVIEKKLGQFVKEALNSPIEGLNSPKDKKSIIMPKSPINTISQSDFIEKYEKLLKKAKSLLSSEIRKDSKEEKENLISVYLDKLRNFVKN